MRTVLIGAVESTAVALEALQQAGHPPAMVLTLSPELGPRQHSDYVDLAPLATADTEVRHIQRTSSAEVLDCVRETDPDFLFVIGWSQLVGPDLRAAAKTFTIGFHPTALPRHRGRAPIAWSILLGLRETGSSLFIIDEGTDTGPILAQRQISIDPRETVASLITKQLDALRTMLSALVPDLASGNWEARPQDHSQASYCAARGPRDGLIDWKAPADEIDRLVRASGHPYPGAFAYCGDRRVTVWSSEPENLPHPYYAGPGQVVCQIDDRPVVCCGDGRFLRLTDYATETGERLKGQVRLTREIDLS
jgi:methionyl-tRNA formyltransferase